MDNSDSNINNQKFITNDPFNTLSERFNNFLLPSKFFDVLVAYFRLSGFKKISESLKDTEKIRILIGINTDNETNEALNFGEQKNLDLSYSQAKKNSLKLFIKEIEN